MKPKIGIDLDQVVCDIQQQMIDIYNQLYPGENLTKKNWTTYYLRDLTSKEREDKVLEILAEKRIYRNMEFIPHAKKSLQKLAQSFDLCFVTHREWLYEKAKQDTVYSLTKDEIPYVRIFFTEKKARVAKSEHLKFFIEDNLKNALEISQVCPCYLFDYPYNREEIEKNSLLIIRGFENQDWWNLFMQILEK
ncbi:MAG: hypothetical protein ABIG37_03795 [Nanoarchaeota archaeon]|nr:hypothetical protein [Nanoarchaeota archaeon]